MSRVPVTRSSVAPTGSSTTGTRTVCGSGMVSGRPSCPEYSEYSLGER